VNENDYESVAELYDTYVSTSSDLPLLVDLGREAGCEVLELMSGTGRVTIPLLQAGVPVTAVDRSPRMLEVLRDKLRLSGLVAAVRLADVRDMDLGQRFGMALLPFQSFSEIIGEEDRHRTLDQVAEHLEPGGRFLLTMHNPPHRLRSLSGETRRWGPIPHPAGGIVFEAREQLEKATGVVTSHQRIELRDDDGVRLREVRQALKFVLPTRGEIVAMAQGAGLVLESLWGDYDRRSFDAETSPYITCLFRR
jgi:SAM-dependent methyltransferase